MYNKNIELDNISTYNIDRLVKKTKYFLTYPENIQIIKTVCEKLLVNI